MMSKLSCDKRADQEATKRPWRRWPSLKAWLATTLVGLFIGGFWMADWKTVPPL